MPLRYFRRLAWILGIVGLTACAHRQIPAPSFPPPPAQPNIAIPEAHEPPATGMQLMASLSKSPCFGSCPAFEVWIYSDGTVIWCGDAHVERIGVFKALAPPDWLEAWHLAAANAGYWNLKEWYPADRRLLQDVPLTVSYLKAGKKERRIVNNADAPPALLRLEKYWMGKLEELRWVPD
jgi:hypothetical protein